MYTRRMESLRLYGNENQEERNTYNGRRTQGTPLDDGEGTLFPDARPGWGL